ncbi:PIN domain-containing protein [Methylorubrum populi]
MRYLLDTNILAALIRSPRGPVTEQIRRVGEARVCTSVIVEAELRYGAAQGLGAAVSTGRGRARIHPDRTMA